MSKFGLCTRHRYEGGFCADCGHPKPAPWSVRLAAWWKKRRAAKKRRRAKQGPDYSRVRPPPVDREPSPTPAPPPKRVPTLLDLITCQCCGAVPQFPDMTCKACREHNRSAAVDALRRANCEIDRLKATTRPRADHPHGGDSARRFERRHGNRRNGRFMQPGGTRLRVRSEGDGIHYQAQVNRRAHTHLAQLPHHPSMPVIDLALLPAQYDFFTSTARETLYSGAFGAGKTRGVCHKLVSRASTPGAREGLCRKNLVTLRGTTLVTLLEGDGEAPPILPPGTYTHNKSDKVIRLRGGGSIVYFGIDDPDKVGGRNLSGCGIDEAIELEERDYVQITGRCRVRAADLPNQIYSACNPGPPSHFLAKRFGICSGHQAAPNTRVIMTRTPDNWYLPPDYVESLAQLSGVARKRYFEGLWVGSEGLVYDRWDRQVFGRVRDEQWRRIIVGGDAGYSHPAVLLVIGEDGDGRRHVISEWYKSQQLEPAIVAEAERIREAHNPEIFVVDSEAAGLIASMRAAGLPVHAADKGPGSVWDGIQLVQKLLVVPGDGRPRLTIDPICVNTIREFETYEWLPNPNGVPGFKDEPRKQFDDAMDALRYAVTYMDGPRPRPMIVGRRRD